MVRRWSYINAVNEIPVLEMRKIRVGSMDTIVNSLMYLRRDFPKNTHNYRKGWARRKHSNDLIFLSNIMTIWAKEYRFYKNYNRATFYQHFFKNTYLSFNLNIQTSLPSRHTRAGVAAVGSGWTYALMKYFMRQGYLARFHPFLAFKGVSWSYASYLVPYNKSNAELYKSGVHVPFLASTYRANVALNLTPELRYSPLTLLSLISQVNTAWYTALYSLLVKLFWFRCL